MKFTLRRSIFWVQEVAQLPVFERISPPFAALTVTVFKMKIQILKLKEKKKIINLADTITIPCWLVSIPTAEITFGTFEA